MEIFHEFCKKFCFIRDNFFHPETFLKWHRKTVAVVTNSSVNSFLGKSVSLHENFKFSLGDVIGEMMANHDRDGRSRYF